MVETPKPGDPARAQVFTISITPFDEAGRIDEAAFRGHLRRLAAAGMGVYVGGGGSGEGYSLSPAETRNVLDIAVSELKGKVPIRAMGVEPRNADQMIAFLDMARAAGVDAAQVYSLDVGHGHAPTPGELKVYFETVLGAIDMPLVLSTHQSVGYVIPADVIVGLFGAHKQLIGLNCSHQDPNYLRTLIDALAPRADICVGGPHMALMCLALGGHGYLTSEGNLAPRLCMRIAECYRAGDLAGLMNAHGTLLRLFMTLYGHGGIRVTKAILNKLGLPGGYPRKPRLPVEPEKLDRAFAAVEALGLGAPETW